MLLRREMEMLYEYSADFLFNINIRVFKVFHVVKSILFRVYKYNA